MVIEAGQELAVILSQFAVLYADKISCIYTAVYAGFFMRTMKRSMRFIVHIIEYIERYTSNSERSRPLLSNSCIHLGATPRPVQVLL